MASGRGGSATGEGSKRSPRRSPSSNCRHEARDDRLLLRPTTSQASPPQSKRCQTRHRPRRHGCPSELYTKAILSRPCKERIFTRRARPHRRSRHDLSNGHSNYNAGHVSTLKDFPTRQYLFHSSPILRPSDQAILHAQGRRRRRKLYTLQATRKCSYLTNGRQLRQQVTKVTKSILRHYPHRNNLRKGRSTSST